MSKKDRAALNARLTTIGEGIAEIRSEVQDSFGRIGRAMSRLALLIQQGARVREELGADWRPWAQEQGKGFGSNGADLAPPTVYRLRNAGAVAEVLGDAVGEASYLSLVPLYRLLAAATSDEDLAKASGTVSTLWEQAVAKAKNGTPTEEAVRTLVERKLSRGTRGKAGKSAKGRKEAQAAKNKRSRNTPTETTETGSNEVTVSLDPAAIEAASKIVSRFVAKYAKDHSIEPSAVRAIMLGTVRLITEHGRDVVAASLK